MGLKDVSERSLKRNPKARYFFDVDDLVQEAEIACLEGKNPYEKIYKLVKCKELRLPINRNIDIRKIIDKSLNELSGECILNIVKKKYGYRSSEILRMHYQFNYTLAEIGKLFRVSKERIRQIILHTIAKLKEHHLEKSDV